MFSDSVCSCSCANTKTVSHITFGSTLRAVYFQGNPMGYGDEDRTVFLLGDPFLVFAGSGPSLSLGWLHSELSCLWPVLLLSARLATDRTSWF